MAMSSAEKSPSRTSSSPEPTLFSSANVAIVRRSSSLRSLKSGISFSRAMSIGAASPEVALTARSYPVGASAAPGLEPRDELVEAQLLQPGAAGPEPRGAELDQRAALPAQLQRLAQPRLARVQAADDRLDARRGGLVAPLR